MTFDTFELLTVGDKVKRLGKKRVYTVDRIMTITGTDRRIVYVKPPTGGYSIFSPQGPGALNHSSHYLNWDLVS